MPDGPVTVPGEDRGRVFVCQGCDHEESVEWPRLDLDHLSLNADGSVTMGGWIMPVSRNYLSTLKAQAVWNEHNGG